MKPNGTIAKIASSYKTTIAMLLAYAVGLAIATFIENRWGTPLAKTLIYYSSLFILLQFCLVINFICTTIKYQLFRQKRWGFLTLHSALIVILCGAFITHVSGKEGAIHLREGQRIDEMLIQTNHSTSVEKVPFQIELVQFNLSRYPNSDSPSSFESHVRIYKNGQSTEKTISMNNTLDVGDYRLFQSSYDKDEKGSILSVNKDLMGRYITYIGYFLLFLGFTLTLFEKNSRLCRLIREFNQLPKLILVGGFILFTSSVGAQNYPSVDKDQAAAFGALPMLSQTGRVQPVNTYASEVLRKLYHNEVIGELDANQFLLGLLTHSDDWFDIPLIKQKNGQIAFNHDLRKTYCSYNELFDSNGNYKLQDELNVIFRKPPTKRNKYDKDLIKLDEKINIFHQLVSDKTIHILPTSDPLVDNQKIRAELTYNRLNIFQTCKKHYLIWGGLLLIFSLLNLFSNRKWLKWIIKTGTLFVVLTALYHFFGIGLRWYIAGRAPWSNSFETIVLLSFITIAVGFVFGRKISILLALSSLFAGILLFASGLNWMNPQITPLVPVLKSPWLMFHVAVIMGGYGFFGISFLLGTTNLCLLKVKKEKRSLLLPQVRELTIINEICLLIGLVLMTIGTFLGAIWANESWGRYWGWDPKESWALITIVIYTVITHIHLIRKKDNIRLINWLSILGFLCVIMTYFGVNYLLSGMHSY